MKKRIPVLLLALALNALALSVHAQENKMGIGLGPEWNMNSPENFGGGLLVSFDCNLPIELAPFAAGLTITTSNNFSGITVLEPAALFRWYFMGDGHKGFFAQADLGAFLIFDSGDTIPLFLGGIRAGYRFQLTELFYLEPYGRLSYPAAFGIGAVAGFRFYKGKKEPVVEAPPPPPPPPVLLPPPVIEEDTDEEVDTSPPEISVTFTPPRFSPDGDGVDDELTIGINVVSASEVQSWHIEIREPVAPFNVFDDWQGEGMPPETLVWDGRSTSGELVQSASSYHFGMMVSNLYDYAVYQGTIDIDILVQRDGDVLRVIVPSIVFAPNSGEFIRGVSEEVAANNEAILQRIAEILNKSEFSTYRIQVEGHANPTTAPNTRARTNEENGTRNEIGLLPLSETRAKTVVDYLANHGVDRERLTPVGVGSARTVVDFADRDNWWKNRRVEFILESKE